MSLLVFGFFQTSLPLQSRFVTPTAPWRKAVCNSGFKQKQESQELCSKGCAAQRGRDAFGTATRISASLFRRLSVFFESTPDQGPKAAKFAVLPPGHAGFPKRAERSEGSDTTPIRNAPCFAVCALVCDLSPKAECVPAFTCESERGPFVREVEKRDERWSKIELLLIVRVHREPGNVCI